MNDAASTQYPFPRTRWQAGVVHLGISALVGAVLFALIRFAWYPDALFTIAGGSELALLIISCDVVIGPLLTTLVFKRGKKTLRFDLWVIGLLQLAAFVYGTWVMFTARPAFMVAAVDRVYAIGYNQIDPVDFVDVPPTVTAKPFAPAYYGVSPPNDPQLVDALLWNELTQGKDLQLLPRWYRPFDESRDSLLRNLKVDSAGRRYVPLIARKGVGLAFVDETGTIVGTEEGDPWMQEAKPPE